MKIDALLRFHYKVDPDNIEDDEYYKLFNELMYIKNFERNIYKSALVEVVNEVLQARK